MAKIHLDTDIGGDMDDVCALAMLLKWPDLEITGVTREGWLFELPDSNGIPTRLVTKIDGNAFNEYWCNILCH